MYRHDQRGFTLVEIIAVLVLLGVLAAIAIPKYIDMTDEAMQKAIDAAVAELNTRESLTWGSIKMTATSPIWSDDTVWNAVNNTLQANGLGADYSWTEGPTNSSGKLSFQGGTAVSLQRSASAVGSPGRWSR